MNSLILDKLDMLLDNKSLEQMSLDERRFVLEHMTHQAYEEMHAFQLRIKQEIIPEIEPSAFIKSKLKNVFQTEEQKKSVPFFSRKVSLFQVAAVAAICFIIGFGIKSIDSNPSKSDTIVDSIIYDTVQVVKYIQMPLTKYFAHYQPEMENNIFIKSFPTLNSNFYHQMDAVMYADNNTRVIKSGFQLKSN